MLKRLDTVRTDTAGGVIHLFFRDGSRLQIDRNHFVEQGGIYQKLADDDLFSRAEIVNDGLTLQWPGDPVIDLFAPTLWDDFSDDREDDTPTDARRAL